jgi:glycosyltransferase involved in cell wall biosynthesis
MASHQKCIGGKMKILYFYQYFSTSRGSWGTRVHEFTSEWVKKGHSVTVITSVYAKSDLKASKFIEVQTFDGVKVIVVNVRVDNKQSFLKRIYTFLVYAFLSSWYALTSRYDVAVASSGPITAGLPGLIAKYIRRKKMVFEVRDLWPQGAIEMDMLRQPLLIKMAYWFERFCYRSADLIVALSPGMKKEIEQKWQGTPVISITNAANIELFSTPVEEVDLASHGLQPKAYALYAGNIGKVNNVEWMYEAARLLQEKGSRIRIALIGDGQLREGLIDRKNREGLTHLVFVPLMPKRQLVGFVQQSLVSLVPLANKPVLITSSPNKFYESLAAGVPVIQTTNGWMKDFVDTYQVGFTVDPDDPAALVSSLTELDREADKVNEMKSRCQSVASAHFDKRLLADRMLLEIETIVQ